MPEAPETIYAAVHLTGGFRAFAERIAAERHNNGASVPGDYRIVEYAPATEAKILRAALTQAQDELMVSRATNARLRDELCVQVADVQTLETSRRINLREVGRLNDDLRALRAAVEKAVADVRRWSLDAANHIMRLDEYDTGWVDGVADDLEQSLNPEAKGSET